MSIFVGPLPSTTYNISNPISASGGSGYEGGDNHTRQQLYKYWGWSWR
jgi:hypothetical protein